MIMENKSTRNSKVKDEELNVASSSKSVTSNTKDIKLKSKNAYLASPYLQSLLPIPPKQGKNNRKPSLKVSKLNKAPIFPNVNAANQNVATLNPVNKTEINSFIKDVSFKTRPVTSLHCQVTLKFVSNNSAGHPGRSHQICVQQQHCGGNPIAVYQGWHIYGDQFTFTSKRQQGFPFSVTLIINNLLNLQLSACCEYKYQHGRKLGGGKSQFILLAVIGSFPCYRCQMRRNQKTGSVASTQSSEYSKVDDFASECSNDRELDNYDSPQHDYEDDFEEENEEESILKFSVESCSFNDTIQVEIENNETRNENVNKYWSLDEIMTQNETPSATKCEIQLENTIERIDEIDTNVATRESANNEDQLALLNLNHLCSVENSEDEEETKSSVPSSSVPANQLDDNIKKDIDQETYDVKDKHESLGEDDDDHTTNDDAEPTVTSDSDPTTNSDTDEDVCYSYEAPTLVTNSTHDIRDFFHVDTSVGHKPNIHFDSSDEEDNHTSPQITIWADVHACEIQSPTIGNI